MKAAELRDYCLSLREAEETFPFGPETSVFKVAGKMFALSQLGADSLRVSLKCEPDLAEALRAAHAAVLPGYHLNKASLEHGDHRWLAGGRGHQGNDRRLVRPRREQAAACQASCARLAR
jgi:predicted DNA-binding protein (MmcQ/YjbR family)